MSDGWGKFVADVDGLVAKLPHRVEAVVAKAALDTEARAKMLAPVDTGNLKNSIGSSIQGTHAEVGPTAKYGEFVEMGTSRTPAQPYMGPATDVVAPQMIKALEYLVEEEM